MSRRKKDWDDICYPFIHETSCLCDFEVLTDELCSEIGSILTFLPDGHDDIANDLVHLQPLCWHMNGSIRGRLAINESDIRWLQKGLTRYRETTGPIESFVLPGGPVPVPNMNRARSITKKTIRAMVKVQEEGIEVPAILFQFGNLLCNFLFSVICVFNHRSGFREIPFQSKSYGNRTE